MSRVCNPKPMMGPHEGPRPEPFSKNVLEAICLLSCLHRTVPRSHDHPRRSARERTWGNITAGKSNKGDIGTVQTVPPSPVDRR